MRHEVKLSSPPHCVGLPGGCEGAEAGHPDWPYPPCWALRRAVGQPHGEWPSPGRVPATGGVSGSSATSRKQSEVSKCY